MLIKGTKSLGSFGDPIFEHDADFRPCYSVSQQLINSVNTSYRQCDTHAVNLSSELTALDLTSPSSKAISEGPSQRRTLGVSKLLRIEVNRCMAITSPDRHSSTMPTTRAPCDRVSSCGICGHSFNVDSVPRVTSQNGRRTNQSRIFKEEKSSSDRLRCSRCSPKYLKKITDVGRFKCTHRPFS